MQLLTPSEAQKRSRNDTVLDAARKKELSDAVNDKRIELAHLEEAGAKFLASQRARWAIEEQDHANRASEMATEITVLEERRAKALIPIEELQKNAENKMQEATRVLAQAEEKVQNNDNLTEVLEQRLDELSEREYKAKKRDDSLDRREYGIEMQETLTSQRAKTFSDASVHFTEKAQEREKGLDERESLISIREFAIKSREDASMRKELELHAFETNLKSRWEELERTAKDINKI